MSAGQLPVDLILFGMIALFLVLRLRSILGKRQGFEGIPEMKLRRGPGAPTIEGRAEAPAEPARKLPDPASATGQALAAMKTQDRNFDPSAFLSGAEGAFRLIVTSFAAGERDKLRPLLTPEIFTVFEGAIAGREQAGHTQRTEIRSILESTIESASLQGAAATITVRFVSHQITLTTGSDGAIISGADAVTELVDVWTFSRDLKAPGQAWRLCSTQAA